MSDTLTPFLKLHKPPFDSIPWDEAVNGNMDTIDGVMAQFMNIPNFTGVWKNSTPYVAGQVALDPVNSVLYQATNTFTSSDPPATFAEERAGDPAAWVATTAGIGSSLYAPLVSPAFTGDPTAPTPAPGDNDTSVATTEFVTAAVAQGAVGSSHNVGRNYIHNPMFRVNQRGFGPWTTSVHTSDRWLAQVVGDTISYVVGTMSDGDRAQIQDEEATRYLSNTFTGNAAATSFNLIAQRIEDVRRLAGKTVTVSFWANSGSGIKNIGVNFLQNFGTGGSPSGSIRALTTGLVSAVNTTWSRQSFTASIPSIAGKTLGSVGNNFTELEIWFSAGANAAAVSGNVGVQSGAISLWGIQVEVGSELTLFEKPDYGEDWANCMRFFQLIPFSVGGMGSAGVGLWQTISHIGVMRNTPTPNVSGGVITNGTPLLNSFGPLSSQVGLTATIAAGAFYNGVLQLAADL